MTYDAEDRPKHAYQVIDKYMDSEKLRRTLYFVVQLLVSGQYEDIETLTAGRKMKAQAMRGVVEKWPHRLIVPPTNSLTDLLDGKVIDLSEASPMRWLVHIFLWTKEEGKSDLTLILVLQESETDLYQIEVNDIHVL